MFIDEQQSRSIYDFKQGVQQEHAFLERYVWSPRSCRFTSWTYEPLVKVDERGRMSDRRRCPFVVWPQRQEELT